MRTSEMAARVGVNTDRLRHHERRGLLKGPPRTAGGYRDYPSGAVELLRFIKRAQELGFTVEEVDDLIHLDAGGRDNCDVARGLAEGRRADLESWIADLQPMSDSITVLNETCGLALPEGKCALLEAMGGQPTRVRSYR